jgi:cephalosporin hydroxylase
MKDLTSTRRSGEDTARDVLRERVEHAAEIEAFHRLFYASRQTMGMTYFEGVPVLKNPLDLWVYQEIVWGQRPTLIIETGTAFGGSALYFARQLDRVGEGMVLSLDIEPAAKLPSHQRICYMKRVSSTDPDVVAVVAEAARRHPRVMVVLDSDHGRDHVLAELAAYAPLVSPEQFLVVEDTDINGRPVPIDWKGGPGPGPAVDAWLPEHREFQRAVLAERYMISSHTWLRRRAEGELAGLDAGRQGAAAQGAR